MRRSLLLHVMLAAVWAAITGSFSGPNLMLGFVLGYVVMRSVRPLIGADRYFGQLWRLVELALFFVRELVTASVRIAIDVVTPSHRMQPAVIAVPLDIETSGQITFLANLISLTPGTLSLDVSDDRSTLYIHVMYVEDRDVDAERARVKRTLERRVQRIMGGGEVTRSRQV